MSQPHVKLSSTFQCPGRYRNKTYMDGFLAPDFIILGPCNLEHSLLTLQVQAGLSGVTELGMEPEEIHFPYQNDVCLLQ